MRHEKSLVDPAVQRRLTPMRALEFKIGADLRHERRQRIGQDRIHSETPETAWPISAIRENPRSNNTRRAQHRESAGKQHKRAGPQIFVDWKIGMEQCARQSEAQDPQPPSPAFCAPRCDPNATIPPPECRSATWRWPEAWKEILRDPRSPTRTTSARPSESGQCMRPDYRLCQGVLRHSPAPVQMSSAPSSQRAVRWQRSRIERVFGRTCAGPSTDRSCLNVIR